MGICTNRVISDNQNFFINDLKEALCSQMGLDELYIIPAEPGDDTGHVDGLVRFINDKTLVVSDYPYTWEDKKGYISYDEYQRSQEFVKSIACYFEYKRFNVFKIPNGIPMDSKVFERADGNYVNYLKIGDKLFIPSYENPEQDKEAIKAFIDAGIDQNNIIPVKNCNQIAQYGGVLNCITTHIHKLTDS